MNICIIGTGISGLMAACEVSKLRFVDKITIIGSQEIPSIKVGESTTHSFFNFVKNNFEVGEFVQSTDAAVKYGVYYKNWSKRDFIHHFNSNKPFFKNNIRERYYAERLANKDPGVHLHDLMGNKLWNFIHENKVSLDIEEYPHSWHFDAGKFKIFLKNHLKKNNKITFFDDLIIECKFSYADIIKYVVGKSKKIYIADYFINCCGDNEINEKIFKEKYISFSSYLLTNKALVYPLKYTDKKDQFYPYTVAKTMKHGWRWITPTQSRIGTGYVFSDNHISVDEATNEFLEDIGDKTIQPFLVDFNPKYNLKKFKINSCTIGMSSGFLEPLDAPGLSDTIATIRKLTDILISIQQNNFKNIEEKNKEFGKLNLISIMGSQFWCSFILHQYKTCWRNDSQFWIDHKNVECQFYDEISNFENIPQNYFERNEYQMFFKTTAGKDIQWKSRTKEKPFILEEPTETKTIHHLEYIKKFYNQKQ